MPNNTELLAQINDQLNQLDKAGGVPVDAHVKLILHLISQFLQAEEDGDIQVDPKDFQALQAALANLQTALQQNTDADAADHATLTMLLVRVSLLEQSANEDTDTDDAQIKNIVDGELAEIKSQLLALQQLEGSDKDNITNLLVRVSLLEQSENEEIDVTESDVRRIIGDELQSVNAIIIALQTAENADEKAIADLNSRVTRLEQVTAGSGLPEAEVRRIISEEIAPLQSAITALQQSIQTEDNRISTLESKVSALEVKDVISHPEAQTLLDDGINTALSSVKTDIADLKTRESADAANITDLSNRVAHLEQLAGNSGLPESEVRRIIGEELVAIKAAIDAIKTQDDTDDQALIKTVQDQITLLQGKITALESKDVISHPEAQSLIDSAIAPVNAAIAALKLEDETDDQALLIPINDKISSLEGKVTTLEGKDVISHPEAQSLIDSAIAQVNAAIAALKLEDETDDQALLSPVNDKITTLEGKVATLEGKDVVSHPEVQTLIDAAVASLNAAILALQQKDAADDNTLIDPLKSDIITLKGQVTALEAKDVISHQETQTLIDSAIAAVTAAIAAMKLQDDSDDEALISPLKDQIAVLEAKVATLESTVSHGVVSPQDAQTLITNVINQFQITVNAQLDLKADKTDITKLEGEIQAIKDQLHASDENSAGSRLARLCLTGWGIVGGLDVHSDEKDYIYTTPGIGVTPTGQMIVEPVKHTFSHCQLYADASKYSYFLKPDGKTPYEIWELLEPSDNLPDAARPLTPRDDAEFEMPFITDKIILILPAGDQLHYLLINREDLLTKMDLYHTCNLKEKRNADFIFENNYSNEDDVITDDEIYKCLNPAAYLPEIPLFRFGFFTAVECSPEDLDSTDFPEIETLDDFFNTWVPIIEDALGRLDKAIKYLIDWYHPVLFPLLDIEIFKEKLGEMSEKWTEYSDAPKPKAPDVRPKYYAQYFYDWARDLINAYDELRIELIELMDDLRPFTLDTLALQNWHLVLGPALQPDSDGLDPALRNAFRQPPIYNDNAARLETCRLYYRRIFKMIEGFYLEGYDTENKLPGWCWCEDDNGEVVAQNPDFSRLRITPGKSYFYPLSQQSVPYYYPLNDNPESLQHFWNYRRSKTRSTDKLLSYHATDAPDFPSYSIRREVVRPLYYTLDPHDFYRIEGYIGQKEVSINLPMGKQSAPAKYPVYDALVYLVQKYNLDFAVRKLVIPANPASAPPVLPLTEFYAPASAPTGPEGARAFSETLRILGAEHLAGVPKGGTFLLVFDDKGTAIGDFSIPYRCCEQEKTSSLSMSLSEGKCTGQELTLIASVLAVNPPGSTFNLYLDGALWAGSPFRYSDQSTVVVKVNGDNGDHLIRIEDSKDTSLDDVQSFKALSCICNLTVTAFLPDQPVFDPKNQDIVLIVITVVATNPSGDSFVVKIMDQKDPVGTFKYDASGTTRIATIPIVNDGVDHIIVVEDKGNPNCANQTTVNTSKYR